MTSRPGHNSGFTPRRVWSGWLVAAMLAGVAIVAGQVRDRPAGAGAGTATLAGIVIADDGSDQPVRRAVVSISSAEMGPQRQVSTDDQGHFTFTDLPAGAINVTVTKPGYVTTFHGARKPGRAPGMPILIAAGQRVTDLTVKLLHGASISGTVLNQNGQGQYDMRVRVFEYQMQDGVPALVTAAVTASGGSTDDRGRYRLFGLSPGTYVLSVTPEDFSPERITRAITDEEIRWAEQFARGAGSGSISSPAPPPSIGRAMSFVPVYYPGVTDPAAIATITLGPADERTGADFKLPLVPTARLEGTVVGLDGQPARTGVRMSIVQPQPRPPSAGGLEIQQLGDGRWVIPTAPPGRYAIVARAASGRGGGGASGSPPNDLFALLDLHVTGDDVSGLVLHLRPGSTVSGRVVFDGRSLPAPTDVSAVRVAITPVPGSVLGGAAQTASAGDGTFTFSGLAPGPYRFTAIVPVAATPGSAGWTLASALVGDRDTLDTPLDVRLGENVSDVLLTLTDQLSELSGSVIDDAGKAVVGDYTVVVFSTDRAFWTWNGRRGRAVRPASDGKFSFTGLPPGEYFVALVADSDPPDFGDAAWLGQLAAQSVKVTLAAREKRVLDVKMRQRLARQRAGVLTRRNRT